jgi:Class II flagellar assembly regulator
MKIEGPNKSQSSKGVSKTGANKGASGASFSGMIDSGEEAAASKPASGVMQTSALDALLSVQEAGDSTESTKRAKRQGLDMLDQLDRIRMGLLTGGIPASALEQLERMVTKQREKIMDPVLTAVLDEIELRVQVELAKLSQKP